MSDPGTISSARAAWSLLHSTPLWFLTATTVVLAVAWKWPEAASSLPEAARTHLSIALLASGILTASKLGGMLAEAAAERRRHYRKRDQKRLSKIYRPLYCLFTTRHVEIVVGIGAGTLRKRIGRAWQELFYYRRPLVGIRQSFRALGDRLESTSAEMTMGAQFPLKAIITRVHANSEHADAKLLHLIGRADKSAYEGASASSLTSEEFALYSHIVRMHDALASGFS